MRKISQNIICGFSYELCFIYPIIEKQGSFIFKYGNWIILFKMKLFALTGLIAAATCLFAPEASFCGQGKIPNSNKICIEPNYIEGCAVYASPAACQKCQYRYELMKNGLCKIDEFPTQSCCTKHNSMGRCEECNTGLFLIDGKCQESNIIGCLQKDRKGACINCASGFVLENGKCQSGIKGCVGYTDAQKTVCQECTSFHSLVNNACISNVILGCASEFEHSCKKCYPPFESRDGHCEIKNCKTYNELGCTACNCGFFLTDNKVCKQYSPGCIRYQRGTCTDCMPHFKLKGNICDIEGCLRVNGSNCDTCDTKYDLVDGGCEFKNCAFWSNGKCETCKEGFNYKQGECVANGAYQNQIQTA